MCLLLAALAPASASAAPVPVVGAPEITDVSPPELQIGDVLTIRGQGFRPGRLSNQVVFARPGFRPVFAFADVAKADELAIRVPVKLLPALVRRDGQPVPTRFRVSVLSTRLSPVFTPTATSPLIGPPARGVALPGGMDCDGDGQVDVPMPQVLGVPVVGLYLPGLPAPGVEVPGVPDVPGLPGIEQLGVPDRSLPALSTPTPAPSSPTEPACPPPPPPPPPPPAPAPQGSEDDEETEQTETTEDSDDSDEEEDEQDKEDKAGD